MFERLTPRTPWAGGRMTDTDVLTLADAASMATKHAGEFVTTGDILRAAARGEITLRATVHRTTKVQKHDGGIYCNGEQENENKVPAGAIATLPLTACQHLAAAGRASWRTFDGFDMVDGVLQRYTKGHVVASEPDFETVPDDCRVLGYDVHALADEYITPAPFVAKEVRNGNVLTLPNCHTHIPVGELPLLIADTQWPHDGTDDEGWEINHATCEIDSEAEIKEAVQSGVLSVKKPSTFAPLTYLQGNAWKTGVVTIADLQAYLAERGITLAVADAPAPQDETNSAAPVVAAGASGDVGADKAGPGWSLKTAIQRYPSYRWPLCQFLKAAHMAGQPCPKARDVVDAWASKPPPNVQVMSDGIKYDSGSGKKKEADLKAIQQAIEYLLN